MGSILGPTNSSVAVAHGDGRVEMARFPALAGLTESFRSVLYLEQAKAGGRTGPPGRSGVKSLRVDAERQFGVPVLRATVGRPVRFVGAETVEDDAFAVGRLRAAFAQAGFEAVEFEMEPVAAAYAYEAGLEGMS